MSTSLVYLETYKYILVKLVLGKLTKIHWVDFLFILYRTNITPILQQRHIDYCLHVTACPT
jgi:hypothetical protein